MSSVPCKAGKGYVHFTPQLAEACKICNPGLPPKQKPARVFFVSLGLPNGKVVTVSRVDSDEGQVACQFEPALESAVDRTIAHALFSRAVLAVEKI